MLYSGLRKANGIFGFNESITKYCSTALVLNQFSYPKGKPDIKPKYSVPVNSVLIHCLLGFSMETHYLLHYNDIFVFNLCVVLDSVHNEPYIVIIRNVKQVTV